VGVRLGRRAGFQKGEDNYLYRHSMTMVLIVNRLYRDLTLKVFVVNHRYRHLIPSMVEEHGTGIFCETFERFHTSHNGNAQGHSTGIVETLGGSLSMVYATGLRAGSSSSKPFVGS
jgi:hypothetical protein